jgi:Na+-translocating ferredoxin:NAD+ oxidoreductase RnfE subunit
VLTLLVMSSGVAEIDEHVDSSTLSIYQSFHIRIPLVSVLGGVEL